MKHPVLTPVLVSASLLMLVVGVTLSLMYETGAAMCAFSVGGPVSILFVIVDQLETGYPDGPH